MPLDPQARAFLDTIPGDGEPDYDALSPELIRTGYEALVASEDPVSVQEEFDREIPRSAGGIPVRVYRPHSGELPALVYFHGGGFVTGSITSHDNLCRHLANGADCVVVSVDYRLAPEHPFPAAAEDCSDATHWLAEHGKELDVDTSRLAVGGDSAGGNLAASTAQTCRDRGGPALRHQLLIYPVIDRNFETASYRENASGYFLTREIMRWFWAKYLPDDRQADDPRACPSRAENLAGLAPATVLTAEFDPLRDEGEAYAAALERAGVRTSRVRYDGQIHGFLQWPDRMEQARDAIARAVSSLREARFRLR